MFLTIDFGNSRTKLGVFDSGKLIFQTTVEKLTLPALKKIMAEHQAITYAIISSVVKTDKAIINFLETKLQLTLLSDETSLPIKNKYATPHTLGKDRLAVVCGVADLFPKKNCLVINCGTCITYDFITSKKEYLGGSISPGLTMRLQALHHFTQKLPLLKLEDINQLVGTDTNTSILTGVINGTVEEIKGVIKNYDAKYKSVFTVITGGDANQLEKHLKNKIFAAPHLTLVGLNAILQHLQTRK